MGSMPLSSSLTKGMNLYPEGGVFLMSIYLEDGALALITDIATREKLRGKEGR